MKADFQLIRNAHVDVTRIIDDKKHNVAEITINGDHVHRFSARSRVSKHLDLMSPKDLSARLTGGAFFLVDDQLIDFRDGQYNGFTHTDASLGAFMDILGVESRNNQRFAHSRKKIDNDVGSDIILRKKWSDHDIQVPGYQSGADFSSQLSFTWNPFVKEIHTAFDLVRLICTNGMVGLTSFLNNKVPLMNRWEEHLDIASNQIQNKVQSIVKSRVQAMATERASVADCLLLEQHAFDRLYSPAAKSAGEREKLQALMSAVSPRGHLSTHYKESVFVDKNLASQVPSHLSNFDVWNVATELRSHTAASTKSSDNGLDKFANGILFDRDSNFSISATRTSGPRHASFADPERAFYGTTH